MAKLQGFSARSSKHLGTWVSASNGSFVQKPVANKAGCFSARESAHGSWAGSTCSDTSTIKGDATSRQAVVVHRRPRSGLKREATQKIIMAKKRAEVRERIADRPRLGNNVNFVFVGNLSLDVTVEQVRQLFSSCGFVSWVRLRTSGLQVGDDKTLYATVQFGEFESIEKAFKKDGTRLCDRPIMVCSKATELPECNSLFEARLNRKTGMESWLKAMLIAGQRQVHRFRVRPIPNGPGDTLIIPEEAPEESWGFLTAEGESTGALSHTSQHD